VDGLAIVCGGNMKNSALEMAVGIFIIIGILCVGYLTIKLGKMELLGDEYYFLNARFDTVAGLKKGSQVELAGVQIGQVDGISLDTERMAALVKLKIKKGIEVSDDAIASVKTAGLIGDKYINITPGGSDEILQSGDMILETESPLDIEEMVSKYVFGDV
jgi:phospholipid/cholesterol/gamma-HCH transport system substrate-binding protein